MHPYGNFSADGTEFIVTDPRTPRPFDNFLWNDSVFSSVHQTGVGFLDYQIGETEGVQLFTGVGRICDLEVFGRDHLMSRLIYIRDNDTGEFWNLNWEPVRKTWQEFKCTHGLGYSIIDTRVNDLRSSFRIFIPEGSDPVELWTLQFENCTDRKRNLSVFVYNQYLLAYKWGFNSYGDMLFRRSWFNSGLNAVMAQKKPHISPHDYQTVFLAADEPIVAFDGSRDHFAGLYNPLSEPQAVVNGRCTNTEGSSDSTIGAAQMDFQLLPGARKSVEIILGISDSEEGSGVLIRKYAGQSETFFEALKAAKRQFLALNRIVTPDSHFNSLANGWIRHQTSFGARWCRWGWMGYRDIVQHGYGVSTFNPTRTREILEEALQYQNSNGMALRGWNPVDEKAYSDSALWLVYTLVAYLRETADFGFLKQLIPYFDTGEDTVLSHIERALDFLEHNKGSHELCLIKFGDWNDSLTGVGKEGRGESIWLSMAYAEALTQLCHLFEHLGETNRVVSYRNRYDAIREALNQHSWDGEWYIRCFDDDGHPVGSNRNTEGKIFLNAQSWAMIAGIADDDKTARMIRSAETMLKTDVGYRLLAPTFRSFDPHVGRISCMQPGICENGTIYSHVNIWYILGLLRSGLPDAAYDAFRRFAPGYLSGKPNDPKKNMPPYIFANGYFGPDHRNNPFQMEFTWITGSVAWHYNVLIREMIGIQPNYDSLDIHPKIPSGWDTVTAERIFRGKAFHITIRRSTDQPRGLYLNGTRLPGNSIPLSEAQADNRVDFFI